jgi:hypothetical protein
MNPLSRSLAALAAAIGFYGCDGIHLRKLKPGSATAADVRERLGAPPPNGRTTTAARPGNIRAARKARAAGC